MEEQEVVVERGAEGMERIRGEKKEGKECEGNKRNVGASPGAAAEYSRLSTSYAAKQAVKRLFFVLLL